MIPAIPPDVVSPTWPEPSAAGPAVANEVLPLLVFLRGLGVLRALAGDAARGHVADAVHAVFLEGHHMVERDIHDAHADAAVLAGHAITQVHRSKVVGGYLDALVTSLPPLLVDRGG